MEAAFFDLDKTILARSSGLMFGRNLYREGLISKRTLLSGLAAQLVYLLVGADENKMEKMREKLLALTKGWDRARVQEIVEEVIGDVVTPVIYKEALDLIEEHKAAGRKVYIVSSSPLEIVDPMGNLLGVHGTIASRGQVDDEGRYTGELDFYCYGANKAVAIKELAEAEGFDLEASFAYSDSMTDLPMLEVVGNPVAANPDRDLRKIAAERNWPVLRFAKPVTIRKRLSEIPPKSAVISGGAALAVAAAVGGYIWLRKKNSVEQPRRLSLIRR